jgi:hypothetical protein
MGRRIVENGLHDERIGKDGSRKERINKYGGMISCKSSFVVVFGAPPYCSTLFVVCKCSW